MRTEHLIQGRRLAPDEIRWLREWIQAHPQWSGKRLARQLCEHWHWRDARGRLKDFAARSLLLKLEAQGHLALPPLQVQYRRARRAPPVLTDWQEPAPWSARLVEVAPVTLAPVLPGTPAAQRFATDWQAKYGHGLDWLETFVERPRFAGTCYRAANWTCVGQTRGRSRQDRDHTTTVPVKDLYLYRLRGGGR